MSRRIKSGSCNRWISGSCRPDTGELFYGCNCGCNLRFPAEALHQAFLREFEYICHDPEKLQLAVGKEGERYKENLKAIEGLNKRLDEIEKQQLGIRYGIQKANGDKKLIDDLLEDNETLNTCKSSIVKEIMELQEENSNLPNIEEIKKLMNSRLPAIEKRIKKINGLAGYSFEDKKRLLNYAFPASNAKNRKYGVTVWKLKEGCYRFEADCILDDKLYGEFYQSDEDWVSDGIYSGKSNVGLSIQEYQWIKIAQVCTAENSVGTEYFSECKHSFICLTKYGKYKSLGLQNISHEKDYQ